MIPWRVPPEWAGEQVFVLGGGPSLPLDKLDALRGKGRVIAVNNAAFRAPWADVLFYADGRWLMWNRERLPEFKGERIVTRGPAILTNDPIHYLKYKPFRLSHDPEALGGLCGGSAAINLAYLFGALRIILLGFDYRPGNFHNEHQSEGPHEDHYEFKFKPAMEIIASGLESTETVVYNTTPGSALTCFGFKSIDEFLT